jgi:hypothetical protein
MENNISSVRNLLVSVVNKSKTELVDILNKTGIPTSIHDTKAKVQANIIKGIAISNKFKNKLVRFLSENHVTDIKNAVLGGKKMNFASQPMYMYSLTIDDSSPSQLGDPFLGSRFSSNPQYDNTFGNEASVQSYSQPEVIKALGFVNADGSTNKEGVLDWLNKALGIYGEYVKIEGKDEAEKLAALQAELEVEKKNKKKSWIVPTLLTAIVVGTLVYLYAKKQK